MDELREGTRPQALDSPALRRVLAALTKAGEPRSAAQLAVTLELHVTTVRSHLDQLEDAGLVTREMTGEGRRGRPSHRYRAIRRDPDAAREELIRVLAAALAGPSAAGGAPARAAGRTWAERVVVTESDPLVALTAAFGEFGFDPEGHGRQLRLRGCPFRQAAREYPDVVCGVHAGLAERLAERVGGEVRVRLLPFVEPELCLVEVSDAE